MTQQIIVHLFNEEFDVNKYEEEGIVLSHFPVHEYNERRTIKKFWIKNWGSVIMHPLKPSQNLIALRPTNQIALYHGVKTGFYFGFHATVISLLIPLSFIALGFQIFAWVSEDGANNLISPFFNIVLSIWGTVFIEKWKQRQSEMAHFWDMSSIGVEQAIPRAAYKGVDIIDRVTNKVRKKDFTSSWKKEIPNYALTLFGITILAASFILFISLTEDVE